MKKILRIILYSTFLIFLSSISFAEESKKDCSEIKNLGKKLLCKVNEGTSKLNEKKSMSEYVPDAKALIEKNKN